MAMDTNSEDLQLSAASSSESIDMLVAKGVYEVIKDAVIIADLETRKLLFCNVRAEQVLGRSREELLHMRAEDLHPPCFAKITREIFRTAVRQEPGLAEAELLSSGGRHIPVSISTSVVSFGGRKALLGIFRDISALLQTELERKQQWTALEQLSDAVLITDASLTILYVNRAFFRITGFKVEEVRGKTADVLRGDGDRNAETQRDMWGTLEDGKVWREEFVNRRKDGSRYVDETTVSPVFDCNGKIVNYVAVKRDVTVRKGEEERRRLEQEELEEAVDLRMEELREAYHTITLQDKMASLGRLTAGIAHELNNPLQLVKMNADILAEQVGEMKELLASCRYGGLEDESEIANRDEEMQAAFEILKKGLQRMERIITNVQRNFSVETREERDRWDLNAVIREIVEILYNEHKYGIDLEVEAEGQLQVNCNRQEIQQVLISLMTNALQAVRNEQTVRMEKNGKIVIRSWIDGKMACFSVEDNVPGIEADEQKKIFDPFFTTPSSKGNTGLGLSIVYEIVVNRHGGTIQFDSPESGGTLVTVALPQGG